MPRHWDEAVAGRFNPRNHVAVGYDNGNTRAVRPEGRVSVDGSSFVLVFFRLVAQSMPTLTPDDFWSAVTASRLLQADQVPQIRAVCEAATAGVVDATDKQTAVAAQWLVQQRLLSLWQAKRLTRGGAGTFFIGDYRLLDRLESPATGVFFRGRHDPSKRAVALVPLDRVACQRVEVWTEVVRQTERAAATTDPVLSRTWAIEDAASGRFVVCESIIGRSLGDELAETGGWPVGQAVTAVLSLARAVAEIHRLGGVHGAISLETVIRPTSMKDVARPALRLLQFPLTGDPLRRQAADPLRTPHSLMQLGQRVCFVPPERLITGKPVTPCGDVFAIGNLLRALLVGRLEGWQGDAVRTAETNRQMITTGGHLPQPPPGCPAEVSQLLTHLAATDPNRRYADAAEAADAIACCLGQSLVAESLPEARPFQENLLALAAGTVSPARDTTEAVSTKSSARRNRLRTITFGGGLAAVAAIVALGFFLSGSNPVNKIELVVKGDGQPMPAVAETVLPGAAGPQGKAPLADPRLAAIANEFELVADDSLPWLPPTAGPPPTFRYLPRGSQLILEARPADLLATADGRLIQQAGDSRLANSCAELEQLVGVPLESVEQLQISWQAGADGQPLVAIWARLQPPAVEVSRQASTGSREQPNERKGDVEDFGEWSRWYPPNTGVDEVVVVSPELLQEIIAAADDVSALPRSMRPLLPILDSQRQFTLFGSPHYFVHDGRQLLPPAMQPLLDPLEQLLGVDCPAAAVSFHLDERTYLEFAALGPPVGSARKLERQIGEGLSRLPDKTEEITASRTFSLYGRRLVQRLPQMLRLAETGLRVGRDQRDLVVANTYLPQFAGHNLALAAVLFLEQLASSPVEKPVGDGGKAVASLTLAERLQRPVTIEFSRDTLEVAVQMLADESEIPMTIAGNDLQLEGITMNQSFGLTARGDPAEEVLLTILKKSDNSSGKLVFVVREDGGRKVIVVTTKTAANKRGESLPAVFSEANAPEEDKTKAQ